MSRMFQNCFRYAAHPVSSAELMCFPSSFTCKIIMPLIQFQGQITMLLIQFQNCKTIMLLIQFQVQNYRASHPEWRVPFATVYPCNSESTVQGSVEVLEITLYMGNPSDMKKLISVYLQLSNTCSADHPSHYHHILSQLQNMVLLPSYAKVKKLKYFVNTILSAPSLG